MAYMPLIIHVYASQNIEYKQIKLSYSGSLNLKAPNKIFRGIIISLPRQLCNHLERTRLLRWCNIIFNPYHNKKYETEW